MPGRATIASVVLLGSILQWDVRPWPVDANAEEIAASLVLDAVSTRRRWEQPVEPIRIVGGLHAVGTQGLGAWLFKTPEGSILLNTGMPTSGPVIVESLRKLQVSPQDIKIIIVGHAHVDHAGAVAYMKKLSGAQLAVMEGDVDVMESGGKCDFQYGKVWRVMGFPRADVDRVLHDGDTIRLGDVQLTAHHTPGHSRGSTTWETRLLDDGFAYTVVFPDGGSINPDYRIALNPSYRGIAGDLRRTLRIWEGLKPDIWLSHHAEDFDFDGKRERAGTFAGLKAWIDPDGYRRYVARERLAFQLRAGRVASSTQSRPAPASGLGDGDGCPSGESQDASGRRPR